MHLRSAIILGVVAVRHVIGPMALPASLNHSKIAAIDGFVAINETRFLVLECVEGDTLAD